MSRWYLQIIFCLITALTFGQELGSERVKEINREALKLNREGEFEEAEKLLEDLLTLLEEQEADISFKAVTWQTLAKVVMNLGEYDRSFDLARRSLSYGLSRPDSINIADNLNTIGVNHYFLSNYDSTTYYYERSLEIKRKISKDLYSLAVSEYNLGIVYEDLGMPDKALEYYHAAEENLLRSDTERNFLPDVYVGISHIHFYSGETDKAEMYAEKSLQEGLESYGPDNPNITFIYTSYANILEYQERYQESIDFLERSLNIRKRSYGENHRWTCETYYDLANVYRLYGSSDKAEELYKQAIEIGEKIGNRQYLGYAKTYLAGLYIEEERNLEQAEKLLKSSLVDQKKIFGDKNEVVAEVYSRMANLSRIKKEKAIFFEYIGKSLSSSNYDKDSVQKVIAPYHALETLLLLNQWHEDRFVEDQDFKNLEKAYERLDEQVRLIEHIQRNFSTDRSKINLANEYRKVFESGMKLCWRLHQHTGESRYLEKAFDLSETNRNSTLLRSLKDIQNRLLTELPEEEIQAEKKIRGELEKVKMDLYYEKSAENPDKAFIDELMSRRIELTASLDSLLEVFSDNYPKYQNLRAQRNQIDLRDVQLELGENSQLIAYFLGQSALYTLSIKSDSVAFFRSEKAREAIEKTEDFKRRLTQREDVLQVSKDLYDILADKQIDPNKEELIIVPDNVLSYIPFEMLTDEEEGHLFERHNISYSAGSRIFLELQNDFFQYEMDADWVGFAPSYEDNMRLFANQEEVESISREVGGDTFLGDSATRKNFLKNNRGYSVLHLATHAEIDNNNPLYNKLIFPDGDLTSSDIYLSDTRAKMAVLSACNTGFGKLEKGEGVMSMARAFHFSGVPSVVMSLWKVPDRSTLQIMLLFYKYLEEGESKSAALRKAKLDYIRSTDDQALRHPYYWAGFVVNGNTEALNLERSNWPFIIGTSGLIALFTGFWIFYRRKRVN